MSMLNLETADGFSLTSLTATVNKLPYKPAKIGAMRLFEEQGVTTTSVEVELQDNVLSLLDVQPRGTSGFINPRTKRQLQSFGIPHLPQRDAVMADVVQNIRAFGSENQTQAVLDVVTQRMATMRTANEYTIESHRVAALQGNYYDAAGNVQSLFNTFGVTEKVIPMGITVGTTEVLKKCTAILDAMDEAMGGTPFDGVHVMCSPSFFDDLIVHPKVKELYLNSVDNATLRGENRTTFEFGGVTFERYRGTADVKITDGEARAFPNGAPGLFITRFAPANYAETVNTIGLPMYAKMEPMAFNKGYELEVQSNPLNLCTRPEALIRIKRTAS